MIEHPLRRYRREHGLSCKAIAERVDATKATISKIETGRMTPSLGLVQRLLDCTDLKAEDFFRQVPVA